LVLDGVRLQCTAKSSGSSSARFRTALTFNFGGPAPPDLAERLLRVLTSAAANSEHGQGRHWAQQRLGVSEMVSVSHQLSTTAIPSTPLTRESRVRLEGTLLIVLVASSSALVFIIAAVCLLLQHRGGHSNVASRLTPTTIANMTMQKSAKGCSEVSHMSPGESEDEVSAGSGTNRN